MPKASFIQCFLQGNDFFTDDSTDVDPLALNATAVSNWGSIVWFGGGLSLADVTEGTAPRRCRSYKSTRPTRRHWQYGELGYSPSVPNPLLTVNSRQQAGLR